MRSEPDESGDVYEVVAADQRRTLGPGGCVNLGRHADNHLVLTGSTVSRFHARLSWEAGHKTPTIQDLGSLNGTFVGGARVLRASLGERTTVRVGSVEVSVTLRSPALIPATGGTLVRMFDEWEPDAQGTVDGAVDLQELLLELERNRRTVTVDLTSSRVQAVLVFAGGRVVKAVAAELTGRDALVRLLTRASRMRYLVTAELRPFDGGVPLSIREVVRDLQDAREARPLAS